jgi:delta 1-pyrroline-5-carboxylate dehydrogenase
VNEFIAQLSIFDKTEKESLINYAKAITQESLINRKIDLQGPTGEHNFMYFESRGFVGCFANNIFDYAKQIICALATKNKVILPSNTTTKAFNKLLSNDILFYKQIEDIAELHIALISKNYTEIKELKNTLANRNGLLVITILEQDNGFYPLYLLNTEKSVSINITATGGNVHLININDKPIPKIALNE